MSEQALQPISSELAGLIEAEKVINDALKGIDSFSVVWDKVYRVKKSLQKRIEDYFLVDDGDVSFTRSPLAQQIIATSRANDRNPEAA